MSSESQKSLDDLIKEAELERLKAERERIEEEKLKIKSERKELERKLNLPWFRRPAFLQAVVAGLVAIPLIWFFVGNIIVPSLNKDNIKLAWENEVKADSLRRAKKLFKKQIDSLEAAKETQAKKTLAELEEQKKQYVKIDSIRKALAAEYKKVLNELNLNKKQRSDLEKRYSSLQSEAEAQKQKLENLNAQITRQKESIPVYLSVEQAGEMIRRNGYYDRNFNPDGKGIDNKFSVQKSGQVVYDAATGLTWQQSGSPGTMNYAKAQKYIEELNAKNFAGFNDWRLPALKEAMSLMETKEGENPLYIDPVFDGKQIYIWTSDKSSASRAWYVSFDYGSCGHLLVGYDNFFVRAVRSGQSSR